MTEVLVTGFGALTSHGRGVDALRRAMLAGAGGTPDVLGDPSARLRTPLIHRVPVGGGDTGGGKAGALAVAAAREAVADAGLGLDTRAAVVLGSCLGEASLRERGRPGGGSAADAPFVVATAVGAALGTVGPNISVSNACAAGGFAFGIAADLIGSGEADVVLAGGADAYSRVSWACMDRMGAIDPVRCRPFDVHRRGTVLGEGAGVLVLESARHARRRGAPVRARLTGSGWSCDAGHLTAPDAGGEQIRRAMREAVGDGPVGCVVPHGTGTVRNDLVESEALAAVLGDALARTPLYSLKALLGHTGGASAALAAIAAALILADGAVPPNVPVAEQDPACAVRLPQHGPTPLTAPRVLVNAYAFGGANCSFVLERAS